jgi:hypothetical protein
MQKLPKVIATSVVRSAHQGESHGGVYLIDLSSGEFEQVIDWNDQSINWEGRGGDRGLRGIAFHRNRVYLAASDEIFVYDFAFNRIESFRNQYLRQCHEINTDSTTLYLTSTGLNSVLEFDLTKNTFSRGYTITRDEPRKWHLLKRIANAASIPFKVSFFDPNDTKGPKVGPGSSNLHINNVSRHGDSVMISGTRIEGLLEMKNDTLRQHAPLPQRTHNAAIYREGIIYNDTASNRLVIADRKNRINQCFDVPEYEPATLSNAHLPNDHARQGFARGLCLYGDDVIIGGSSPSTLSAYSLAAGKRISSINISKDIRNCIHGLEVWPG